MPWKLGHIPPLGWHLRPSPSLRPRLRPRPRPRTLRYAQLQFSISHHRFRFRIQDLRRQALDTSTHLRPALSLIPLVSTLIPRYCTSNFQLRTSLLKSRATYSTLAAPSYSLLGLLDASFHLPLTLSLPVPLPLTLPIEILLHSLKVSAFSRFAPRRPCLYLLGTRFYCSAYCHAAQS